jgi:hypothetical protein
MKVKLESRTKNPDQMTPSENKRVRISKLVEDWNVSARLLFMSTKLVLFFYRIFGYDHKDGWRRTTEVHHRNDEAKYIGSLHNLAIDPQQADSDKHARNFIIETLGRTYRNIPDIQYALKWEKHACKRVTHEFADLMEVSYHTSGKIESLSFFPDHSRPTTYLDSSETAQILKSALKEAYNQNHLLPDKKRSIRLYKELKRTISMMDIDYTKSETMFYLDRMINASWISFSMVDADGEERKTPNFFTNRKNAGFGILNTHCKYSPERKWFDIWIQFSHIGIDGRAAAKFQWKILQAFGSFDIKISFPKDFILKEKHHLYKYPDRDVFHGCSFIDLQPMMQLKQKLYDRIGNILPVTLLTWALASHQFFKNIKFNIPVDIPAHGNMERTVGFVFVKPKKFQNNDSGFDSFKNYVRDFNEQIKGIRKRQNENYIFMQSAVMASHKMLELMLKYMSTGLYAFTGDTCITFMENVEYAIPSLSDNINSIIAISLIPKNDNTIACVSIRSKTDTVKEMLVALDEVVGNIDRMANININ